MIKYGLKLWSSDTPQLFQEAYTLYQQGIIQFLEVYVVPDTYQKSTVHISLSLPITIHATHESHGVNFAQTIPENAIAWKEIIQFADYFHSDTIVLHPGRNGTLETTIHNLRKFYDPRILIENMPLQALEIVGGGIYVGAKLDEVQQLMTVECGLCLDFGHAIKMSISLHKDYKTTITQFLRLHPQYFHLTDSTLNDKYDTHNNLGKGEFDLQWIKRQIENIDNARIVFETPKKGNSLKNDVINMAFFRNL